MGKRSSFDRIPRDFYPTPMEAVMPLLSHLKPHTRFAEPCCGDMALARHLELHGHRCYWASDIERRESRSDVTYIPNIADAMVLTVPLQMADCIITNTPWDRKILHPMIEHFVNNSKYTWLLLDAGWAYTKQSSKYMKYCSDMVAVGRVKWIPDSKMSGKDDAAWYRFSKDANGTKFIGRQ